MLKKPNYNKIFLAYDFFVISILLAILILLVNFLYFNFFETMIKTQRLPGLSHGVVRGDINIDKLGEIKKNIEDKNSARSLNSEIRFY